MILQQVKNNATSDIYLRTTSPNEPNSLIVILSFQKLHLEISIILQYNNRSLSTCSGSIRGINDQKRCTTEHPLVTATNELNLECQPAFVENNEFGKIDNA